MNAVEEFVKALLGNVAQGSGIEMREVAIPQTRESVEAMVDEEVRKRYRTCSDKNDLGDYAGVIICHQCEVDHEIVKSAWIFDTPEEALEFAEEMLQGIAESMLEDGLKHFGIKN